MRSRGRESSFPLGRYSPRLLRMSFRTSGAALCAMIRNPSKSDDLPVLFFPVIKVTRPNSGISKCRNPRNPRIVRSGKASWELDNRTLLFKLKEPSKRRQADGSSYHILRTGSTGAEHQRDFTMRIGTPMHENRIPQWLSSPSLLLFAHDRAALPSWLALLPAASVLQRALAGRSP